MKQYEFPLTNDLLTYMTLMGREADRLMHIEYGMKLNEYRALAYVEQGMAQTASELSAALGIAKCKVSGIISSLAERDYLDRSARSTTIKLTVTPLGKEFFKESRSDLSELFDEMLADLSPSQRKTFDLGCTVTATAYDGFRLREEAPDFVYIYLRAFLLTEQFIIKTTNVHGLNLTEFRVLFATLLSGPVGMSALVDTLIIPKSTLSECARTLGERNLIIIRKVDGRTKQIELTSEGRKLAEKASVDVDRSFVQDVRNATEVERRLYNEVATKIVNRVRHLTSNR